MSPCLSTHSMGDEILDVNGGPYMPIASLRTSAETELSFEIKRREQAEPSTIVMKPVIINPKQEMLEAERETEQNQQFNY